jgi:hypothetical protein
MKNIFGLFFVITVLFSSGYAGDIVLQNGLNGYSGCSDAFITNGTKDVPQGAMNFGDQKKLSCDFEHRL